MIERILSPFFPDVVIGPLFDVVHVTDHPATDVKSQNQESPRELTSPSQLLDCGKKVENWLPRVPNGGIKTQNLLLCVCVCFIHNYFYHSRRGQGEEEFVFNAGTPEGYFTDLETAEKQTSLNLNRPNKYFLLVIFSL